MKRIRNAILSVVLTCCMVLPGVMVSAENMDNVQVNTNEENQIATDGSENTEDTDETAEAESQTENTETDIYEAERNDLANSWRYENGQIITDVTQRSSNDQSVKGFKSLIAYNRSKALQDADEIIKNTYRTLLTRGMKGCYIYCTDQNLRNYLKQKIQRQ